jgi:hypothetical protein
MWLGVPVAIGNLNRLARDSESDESSGDGGVLQTELVRIGRAFPIAGLAAGRDLSAAPSTEHPATQITEAARR